MQKRKGTGCSCRRAAASAVSARCCASRQSPPALSSGRYSIPDNPAAHKVAGVRKILQKKGADIRCLPPYSPEINPIEKAIAQLKSRLGKVGARTAEVLNAAVEETANRVTAAHARNHFKSFGYEIPAAT